ncbi:MAG: twin-arginine translocation signal domain-containing protein [Candidatus Kaiserbacteria bacterium]|nr:twin-arginine translocation signal domain-containing protein [Candidatus Kaiserbacteria bacterium]
MGMEFSRRNLLRAGAAMGAAAALEKPTEAAAAFLGLTSEVDAERKNRMRFERNWNAMPATEREQLIDAEVKRAQDFIRGPEGRRILESGTDDELFKLINAMPPLLRAHVKGTKYDVSTSEWPSVSHSYALRSAAPVTKSINSGPVTIGATEKGNGAYLNARNYLTDWHVVEASPEYRPYFPDATTYENLKKLSEQHALDVVHIEMPYNNQKVNEMSKPVDLLLNNNEVHGEIVAAAGLDADATAAADGTKLYPSIAVRVTPHLAKFLGKYARYKDRDVRFAENSFIIIAPPGECVDRNDGGEWYRYIQGMSGCPVMKGGKMAGCMHRGGLLSYNGLSIDFGLFHGPDEIRQARRIGLKFGAVLDRNQKPF